MTRLAKQRLGGRLGRRNAMQGIGSSTARQTGKAAPTGGTAQSANSAVVELEPWVPSAADPFDEAKAAHLMRRAGFGASPEERKTLARVGVHRTVDLLTIPSNWPLQEWGTQILPTGEILNLHSNLTHQRAQWIHEAVFTHYPLKEKMALFWHDHFSVGIVGGITVPLQLPHVNIFRRHGLRKFRDMLVEVSRDPAMLFWLDNRINGAGRRQRINENYGRELLELYTMGEGAGYTQGDVVEASKCLAGWSLRYYNKFWYNPAFARAGAGVKTVLGNRIANANQEQDGYQLIDVLLRQKATAEYITGKIWSYFVAERPPASAPTEQKLWDDIIVELGQRFMEVGYDIRMLMSVILRSKYFFSDRAIGKLVKNPMEYVIGTMRNLDSPFVGRYATVGFRIEQMGLPLFRYSNPSGLDDGQAWIDSQAVINRSNFADDFTRTSTTANFRVRWNPMTVIARHNLTSKALIIDHFLGALVGPVPAQVRANLSEFMDYYDGTSSRVYRPYDALPTNSQYRVSKVRGLVQLILALPEYNIN